MLLKEIPGLVDTRKMLLKASQSGHLPHALLMYGAVGSATMPLALGLMQYINCENPGEDDACGVCGACSKISKHIHPDVHYVYPSFGSAGSTDAKKEEAKNKTLAVWRTFMMQKPHAGIADWGTDVGAENKQAVIGVDDIRHVIRAISLKNFEAKYKVIVIWLPELLNLSAANAMLKVLEEPTPQTLFLLVSAHIEQILPTILSRCQQVYIRPYSDKEVIDYLTTNGHATEKQAEAAARISMGNLHEAVKLCNNVMDDNTAWFRDWMRVCFKRDYAAMVKMAEDFQKLGRESQKTMLQYGLNMMRDASVWRTGAHDLVRLGDDDLSFVDKFSAVIREQYLEQICDSLSEAIYYIERNANPRIVFTDVSIRMGDMLGTAAAAA